MEHEVNHAELHACTALAIATPVVICFAFCCLPVQDFKLRLKIATQIGMFFFLIITGIVVIGRLILIQLGIITARKPDGT